jgi:BirA family biotin operon repressor/biotin-[acetyl-CoA-carboxylase] ligase
MNFPGEKHQILKSTQSALKELLLKKELPSFYYLMAEEQSEGRGRSDHQWNSVRGNLHVSILINEIPFNEITWVPLWIATTVHETLSELGVQGERLNIKWPNDIWLDGSKKTGGILCEKINQQITAGIGLNLKQAPLPDAGVVPSQVALDSTEVVQTLINKLKRTTSIEQIKEYYLRFALFRTGVSVTWKNEVSQEQLQGEVMGLGEYGELQVKTQKGVVLLFSEDVRSVRSVK